MHLLQTGFERHNTWPDICISNMIFPLNTATHLSSANCSQFFQLTLRSLSSISCCHEPWAGIPQKRDVAQTHAACQSALSLSLSCSPFLTLALTHVSSPFPLASTCLLFSHCFDVYTVLILRQHCLSCLQRVASLCLCAQGAWLMSQTHATPKNHATFGYPSCTGSR